MYIQKTPKKHNDQISELTGYHLYQDNKGRTLYHASFHKDIAYYIAPSDFRSFSVYQQRYFLSLAGGVLIMTLIDNFTNSSIYIAVGIAVVIWAVFQFKFKQFLQHCSTTRFDATKLTGSVEINARQPQSRLILKAILFVLLGVLLVINAYQQQFDASIVIGCWIICGGCIIFAVNQLRYLIYKKKHNIA